MTDAKLTSRLPEIAASIGTLANQGVQAGVEAVADGARSRVPVDTGTLREAIHVEEEKEGFAVIAGDDEAFYGHMVEFGTSHSAPEPFLVPAFEANRDVIKAAVKTRLSDL